ncbi:MAG: hypothetical protein HKM93_04585 [Desulfobacteraceae bacterium]|nr:hypothetical protein [Desulfobacteraceae bacterium]
MKKKSTIIILLAFAALASALVMLDGKRLLDNDGMPDLESILALGPPDRSGNPVPVASDPTFGPTVDSHTAQEKQSQLTVSAQVIFKAFYHILIVCENEIVEFIDIPSPVVRPVVFWVMAFLIIGILAIFILAFFQGLRALLNTEKPQDTPEPQQLVGEEAGDESGNEVDTQTVNPMMSTNYKDAILNLFLNIYKIQIGAPREAPARCILSRKAESATYEVYELQVKNKGEWSKRRMSIGPLGEDSGSTSKCFYVLYDTHMVVKIPHVPLTKFNIYIRFLIKQSRIKDLLQPTECIVPKVSVILEKIYKVTDSVPHSTGNVEKEYTRRLQSNHVFQNYLKIGETFVFFMDLAQHIFLSAVNRDIHNVKELILSEINDNFELLWDHQGFVGRYGLNSDKICSQLQHIYRDYDEKVRILLGRHDVPVIHPFQIKKWFIDFLHQTPIPIDEKGLNPEGVSALNDFLASVMVKHKQSINQLNAIISGYAQRTAFERNRVKIKNLITKTLELLICLKDKQIALRDIKPDNLLVVGDPDNYPDFLKFNDQFSIGIIDVETAVSWHVAENEEINQPLLGGTPLYATPTHLMRNELLCEMYDDLAFVYQFQDWFACIGMIYKIITEENLFRNTASLFSGMVNLLQKSNFTEEKQVEVAKQASAIFWKKASGELRTEIGKTRDQLERITVDVPREIAGALVAYVSEIHSRILSKIKKKVDSQTVYKAANMQVELMEASSNNITRLKVVWESNLDLVKTKPQARKRAIRLLMDLETMKKEEEIVRRILKGLNDRHPKIDARQLLETMFGIVMQYLCHKEWKTGTIDLIKSDNLSGTETFYEATQ